jgi:hypothetical protein
MKLTTQQITQIEETLVLNGLKYDDIKLEVTDHIASEIEEKISNEEISFEVAFNEIFEKWKPELRLSSSFWVGFTNSVPKIVLDKWVRITKQQQLKALLIAIVPGLIFTVLIHKYLEKSGVVAMVQIFKTISLLTSFLIIIAKLLIWKSKLKTSFSLIFNKNASAFMVYPILYGLGMLPMKFDKWDFGSSLFFNVMILSLFIYSIFCLKLAYKHFQFEKKITFSNS